MARSPGTAAMAALVVVATVLGAVGAPTASAAAGDLNSLSPRTVAFLFSLDADDGNPSNSTTPAARELAGNDNVSGWLSAATRYDTIHDRPPSTAATWTDGEFADLQSRSYTPSQSVAPASAQTAGGTYIKDAHATVFAVTPSTVVLEGSNRTRYIAPDGRLRALLDYRVDVPANSTRRPDAGPVIKVTEGYTLLNTSIQQVSLIVDGTVVETRNGSAAGHTPTFDYDVANTTGTLTVEATYNVTINKTVTTTKRVRVDNESDTDTGDRTPTDGTTAILPPTAAEAGGASGVQPPPTPTEPDPGPGQPPDAGPSNDGNTTTPPDSTTGTDAPDDTQTGDGNRTGSPPSTTPDDPEGDDGEEPEYREVTTTRSETKTETVTVTYTVDVKVYQPPTADGYRAEGPDGDRQGIGLEASSNKWAGATIGDTQVTTRWGFLTARDTAWDSLVARTGGGARDVAPAVPVQVYAVPRAKDVTVDTGGATVDAWGQPQQPPGAVPDTFTVATPNGSYETVTGLTVSGVSTSQQPSVTVHGLVRGMNRTIPRQALATREIREADLRMEVVSSNATHTVLSVTLVDAATGDPIQLGAAASQRVDPVRPYNARVHTAGKIAVANLRTGETWTVRPVDGTATIVSNGHGTFTAGYKPASWAVVAPAYTKANAGAKDLNYSLAGVLDWLVILLLTFGPFAGLYYALGALQRMRDAAVGNQIQR